MSLRLNQSPELTPRERQELDWEKEATRMQFELAEKQKQWELEVKRLEVKWSQLVRLPMSLVLLPVKLILAFAIPIAAISKHQLPKEYWELLRG